MKRIAVFSLVSIISFTLLGCSTSAILSGIQTTNTYGNKYKLRIGIYLPSEIKDRVITVRTNTFVCSAWKIEMSSGDGYSSAIINALSSCVETVENSLSPISPEIAKKESYDLYVVSQIANENASVSVQEEFMGTTVTSQFQASINLKFFNNKGENIYSYSSNGAGFKNGSGGCKSTARMLKSSMESALQQIADNISQSFYGSVQINNFIRSNRE